MDSLRPVLLLAAIPLALLACQSGAPSGESPAGSTPDQPAPQALVSLRVPADRLSRVELSRGGARPIALEKDATGWKVSAPISYRANQPAVESIVAALAEVEPMSVSEGDDSGARKHGLDGGSAIEVKAWAGERMESHFLVGYSSRDQTPVQVPGDPRLLTVRGRLRRVFDKTLDELRDPVITDFAVSQIEGASYTSSSGRLDLKAHPSVPGDFVAVGPPIRNFDSDRALKDIAVLARLRARGFVDNADSEPFAEDSPRATLMVRGENGPKRVEVRIGARTADGRLPVRTSESGQVFLVSAHLESSLVPKRSQFERSSEMMQQLGEHRDKRARSERDHVHAKPAEAPSQVPPELMTELREMAAAQRVR